VPFLFEIHQPHNDLLPLRVQAVLRLQWRYEHPHRQPPRYLSPNRRLNRQVQLQIPQHPGCVHLPIRQLRGGGLCQRDRPAAGGLVLAQPGTRGETHRRGTQGHCPEHSGGVCTGGGSSPRLQRPMTDAYVIYHGNIRAAGPIPSVCDASAKGKPGCAAIDCPRRYPGSPSLPRKAAVRVWGLSVRRRGRAG
jgi:hypothetical protein